MRLSRPALVKLLESGHIPYEQPGRYRRRLIDLLAYRYAARRDRTAALDDLTRWLTRFSAFLDVCVLVPVALTDSTHGLADAGPFRDAHGLIA